MHPGLSLAFTRLLQARAEIRTARLAEKDEDAKRELFALLRELDSPADRLRRLTTTKEG